MGFLGALGVLALLVVLIVVLGRVRKTVVDKVLAEGRAQQSPVTEFVDDLQRHWWAVVIPGAILLALDQSYHFSHGLLESRLFGTLLIFAIFGARTAYRRANPPAPPANPTQQQQH